jgi:hypothetical protein
MNEPIQSIQMLRRWRAANRWVLLGGLGAGLLLLMVSGSLFVLFVLVGHLPLWAHIARGYHLVKMTRLLPLAHTKITGLLNTLTVLQLLILAFFVVLIQALAGFDLNTH